MSSIQKKALILSTVVLGIGGLAISAHGATRQCASTECACERALEKNTVEALEEFLKKYQHDESVKETACGALGIPPEDEAADNRNADYEPSVAQPNVPLTE